jgi:hypothetical protein
LAGTVVALRCSTSGIRPNVPQLALVRQHHGLGRDTGKPSAAVVGLPVEHDLVGDDVESARMC